MTQVLLNILTVKMSGMYGMSVSVRVWVGVYAVVVVVMRVWSVTPVEVLSIAIGFTLGNSVCDAVNDWSVMVSSYTSGVWISSYSSGVWIMSGVWISSYSGVCVIKKIRISFSFSLTLGNNMCNIWDN